VFADSDAPAFYVANRAHHADVGGAAPGSLPLSDHIDHEGARLGPTVVDERSMAAFVDASRTPDERRGDLAAQLAANRLGVARVEALLARYGMDGLRRRANALHEYSARLMRGVIAAIPDGMYSATDLMDGDGLEAADVELALTLTVSGEAVTFDFTASADQVGGPINAVRAITVSAVFYAMRCLGPADMPNSGGCLEPIDILTRRGSLLDAEYPSPVAVGNVETSQRVVDLVLKALSHAIPERIPAASAGSMSNVCLGGQVTTEGRGSDAFVYYETIGGGAGAGPSWPGASGVHTHMTNTLNTPVEAFEHAYPARIVAYHLAGAGDGASAHGGGRGLVREYEALVPTTATIVCERHARGPWGLAGGSDGVPGRVTLIGAHEPERALPAKTTVKLEPGDRLRVQTPGGGGHGER